MFTPKWKKEARLLAKGARKFVDYKRDLLTPERVDEIESRRTDLLDAAKSGDRAKVAEASKQLRATCENALPREKPQGWFEENVEVMFVAIVIALGLRAYYLQPFRIPTGSMQPTLNGITGTPLAKEEWPSFPVRVVEKLLRGRSYVHVVNDRDRRVAFDARGDAQVRDFQLFHFFSRSELHFHDSPPLRLPSLANPVRDAGLRAAVQKAMHNQGVLPAGTVVAEGVIDTGDLVLVDKFSYHFRKPKRGEVFVFDTIDIEGIRQHSGPQGGGSHYIKRLCGVPGDTLSIEPPNLLIDGKIAQEPMIQKVAEGGPPFPAGHEGYEFALAGPYLSSPSSSLRLRLEAPPGMREYAALGDNTGNSLDSRYWGTVKEFNLVGPALFSLWPVTTGHWGFIR